MSIKILLSTMCVAALITTGCAPKLGGNDYSVANVGDISNSLPGLVISKRVIQINASDSSQPGVGAIAGAGAGALVGSTIGQGKGGILGMAAGGLAGAFGGHFAEQALTHQEGFEYRVRMEDTGQIKTIAQGAEPNIAVGAPVYIIENTRTAGRSRIIPR